ncbi:atherin-like [Panicum virgatum]|uniref:atherin-like n=1 Tax=Panicum virgatum TaxID=38727 RepID=UPI0019D551BC|nr:atherin-like [Panicum virgatum]
MLLLLLDRCPLSPSSLSRASAARLRCCCCLRCCCSAEPAHGHLPACLAPSPAMAAPGPADLRAAPPHRRLASTARTTPPPPPPPRPPRTTHLRPSPDAPSTSQELTESSRSVALGFSGGGGRGESNAATDITAGPAW